MSANSKQVGGDHYKVAEGQVGHWDYCVRSNTPNLEYAASKYIARWRKKNGVQDLEKSIHYIEKRIECIRANIGVLRGGSLIQPLFTKFLVDNNISTPESLILYQVMHWKRAEELEQAIQQIKLLIDKETEGEATAAYVNQG